jgi:glycosyltransferase involved in cell wall biosynthesis
MSHKKSYSIAIVGNTAWGIYNFRLQFLQKLQSLGHRVTVIAPKDEYGDQYSKKMIHAGFDFINLPIDSFGKNPFKDITTFATLYRMYRAARFDFVFHYTIKPNIYGSFAAHLLDIPSIAVVTGLGRLQSLDAFWKKTIHNWYQFGLSFAKEVWFLNEDDKNTFEKGNFLDKNKTQLLQSEGIDTTYFKPKSYKKTTNITNFLFAGRLLWDKGIQELAEAARIIQQKYPNAQFTLAGYMNEKDPNHISRATIEAWEKEGIFRYIGAISDIRTAIAASDVVVLPSKNYGEGVPRILLEAAAMEKPIIAADIAGCKEVIKQGVNGLLFDYNDVANLVICIEKMMLLSDHKRKLMGYEGRKLVTEKFESEIIVAQYIDTLQTYLPKIKVAIVPSRLKNLPLIDLHPLLQAQR